MALTAEDCLKQARECIQFAEVTPDAGLRQQYLKLAAELTRLAALLDPGGDGGGGTKDAS